jgi:predicted nucleic acid-binding protein
MAKYILDTNIASILGAETTQGVITKKLYSLSDNDIVAVSVLTIYEETYGIENSNDEARKLRFTKNLEFIKKVFDVIPLDLKEADIYAKLKIAYKKHTGITQKDAKKNDIDLLIAASVIAENAILVSSDKIFETITQLDNHLKVENWLQ